MRLVHVKPNTSDKAPQGNGGFGLFEFGVDGKITSPVLTFRTRNIAVWEVAAVGI